MRLSDKELDNTDILPVGLLVRNYEVLSYEGGEPNPKTGNVYRSKQKYKIKCKNCGSIYTRRRIDFLHSALNNCRKCPKEFRKKLPNILEKGMVFGNLTVIDDTPIRDYTKDGKLKNMGASKYKCVCTCGNITEKSRGNLVSGHTVSCGCLKLTRSAEVCRKVNEYEVLSSGVVKVKITNREDEFFYLDKSDWDKLKDKCWSIQVRGYISAGSTWTKNVRMLHRVIANASDSEVVDHIDGDPMNNCKSNLRICTQGENAINRYKEDDKILGIREIHKNRFTVVISRNGTHYTLGTFPNKHEAYQARFEGELKHFGEFSPILSRGLYLKYDLVVPKEFQHLIEK